MQHTMRQLQTEWIENQLKQISVLLIDAHRKGDTGVLAHYARRLPAVSGCSPRRQFMKLIQVFHPDRLAVHVDRAVECAASGNPAELASLAAFLTYDVIVVTQAENRREKNGQDFSAGFGDFDNEETYGYSEDDFGFGEDSESSCESEYESVDDPFAEGSFMEAMKREFFGNLDLYPSCFEIEQFDGELDLSDCNLSDLSGAEYCVNIKSLNLAMNLIDNIWPLKTLSHLEFLDLSSNVLENADDLASLPLLSELDLSFNEIDDISFLLRMPALSCVSITGNPVCSPEVIEKLRRKGVIVIQ